MNPDFWRNKRVFLTGHTGFKGSWLSLWLSDVGAHVTGFSLAPPTHPNLFDLAGVEHQIHSVRGDIRDEDALTSALIAGNPEIIIHMAAQAIVRYSYEMPVETFSTNIMGTINVLNIARRLPDLKAVLCVTSDKCYHNSNPSLPFREDDPLGGDDPYSSSKACADLVTSSFRESFYNGHDYSKHGVAIATARSGNVIGGGDFARDRLVPDILSALNEGKPALIRNPASIRPWQHILDPLNGYLILLEHLVQFGPTYSGSWNFGPSQENMKPVSWIADELCKQWSKDASWIEHESNGPREARSIYLDVSKANDRLGWQAKIDLETSMKWTVEWERARTAGDQVLNTTLSHVRQFQGSL